MIDVIPAIGYFPGEAVLSFLAALALGLCVSLTYVYTHKKEGCSGGFAIALVTLPVILSAMLSLSGESGDTLAAAFALAGAIGFLRFRSVPGGAKDFAYILFSLSVGYACGRGAVAFAAVFAAAVCAVMAVLHGVKYPFTREENLQLKITIPENVDYDGLFDDLFAEYTNVSLFRRVRTVEFGSLFEISYEIGLKPNASHKELMDKIRCRNNNLSVSISVRETQDAAL